MAEQLTLALAPPEPPTFANFVAGPNAEVVAHLARLAEGAVSEPVVLVWGASGAGRSHLLQAAVAAAIAAGRAAAYWAEPALVPAEPPDPGALVAIDEVDSADSAAQARLFTLFNALAAGGGQMLAAASSPPVQLALRDDLRTRLGWGLILEVRPLADADKPAALAGYARGRGFTLGDDVIAYLLAHGRRDMGSLVRTLAALDRHSLATKRPITVPLLRQWLQGELTVPGRFPPMGA
jgi:DnaA family protein